MHDCKQELSTQIDSRPHGNYRRRRYVCDICHKRWTTIEMPVSSLLSKRTMGLLLNLSTDQIRALNTLLKSFIRTMRGARNA